MKTTIALLVLTLATAFSAQAKLNDFNSLIEENSKAQKELHADLKQNLETTQAAVAVETKDRYIVDASDTFNSPTRKNFLTYRKAKTDYRTAAKAAQKRLAQEINSAD